MDDGDMKYFDEVADRFIQALASGDIDQVDRGADGSRRLPAHGAGAPRCCMWHDREQMCVVAMMAVSSMARDVPAELCSHIATIGGLIDAEGCALG